jgi:hypothetical protein
MPETKHYCATEEITGKESGSEGLRVFSQAQRNIRICTNGCDSNCPARKIVDLHDEEDFDRE